MVKTGKRSKKKINYDMGENIHDNVTTNRINWFPGHMNKAIRQVKESLKKVDIVLEIRDARSPLATGNSEFNKAIGQKSSLIVINKTNLADPNIVKKWEAWFEEQKRPYIFINCFDKKSLSKITTTAKDVVIKKIRESNPGFVFDRKLKMMIIGLPNTGKSTIINRLANRNATKAADKPGQTQQQLWVKVDDQLELLDTPGIMPPKIFSYEQGLWLAALHAIPATIVKEEDSACFIVRHLLEMKSKIFQERYKLDSLELDLIGALDAIAKTRGCIQQKGQFDYDRVYKLLLTDFRSGSLGPISLGIPPVKKMNN